MSFRIKSALVAALSLCSFTAAVAGGVSRADEAPSVTGTQPVMINSSTSPAPGMTGAQSIRFAPLKEVVQPLGQAQGAPRAGDRRTATPRADEMIAVPDKDYATLAAMVRDEPKVAAVFKSGKGLGWHEHDVCLFRGTERFFRPGYNAHLTTEWIPALDGMEGRLKAGARVADVGCGHGASTVLMAKTYPKSRFYGFDYHGPSIERAREAAREAGVEDRVTFEVASAKDFNGGAYDMIAIFDALHDMGDPVGAAKHIRESLAPDGSWLLVEPFANDDLADNLNPFGRIFYSASTMICTPASLSQEVGMGLGAQAGEKRLRQVAEDAGFTHFKRATETPFNLVFDVRP